MDANISLRNIPKICHEADRLGGLPYRTEKDLTL